MPSAATWMDLEIIILSKVSQKEEDIPYHTTYMWNLKYDTNEFIYKTENDSQIQRTDLWLPKLEAGRDGLGIWDQQMQTSIYRMDKQQGPTVYSTKNYIQ